MFRINLTNNSFKNADDIKLLPIDIIKIKPQSPFKTILLKHKDLDQLTFVNTDLFKFKKWLSNSINLDDLYED